MPDFETLEHPAPGPPKRQRANNGDQSEDKPHPGSDFGSIVPGIFTDEPNINAPGRGALKYTPIPGEFLIQGATLSNSGFCYDQERRDLVILLSQYSRIMAPQTRGLGT